MSPTTANKHLLVLMGQLDPTPANRSVFELFRWLGQQQPSTLPLDIEVISLDDGERRIEMTDHVSLFVVGEKWAPRRPLPTTLQKLHLHRAAALVRAAELRKRFARPIDAAYLADLDGVQLLRWLPPSIPVIGHLHRASADLLADLPAADRADLQNRVSQWIAGDAYARDRLVEHLHVDPDNVAVHADFIQPALLWNRPPDTTPGSWRLHTRQELLGRFAIPLDAPLVCGRGPVDFWFQTDAFVRMCWELRRLRPDDDLHFLWVADTSTRDMIWPLLHDIDHAGLADRVHVIRAQMAPRACVAASDVFVRTSRQILVAEAVEEAAAVGTPTVRFGADDVSPGISGQTIVPWPDVDAMAAAVNELADAPATRARRDEPADWDVRVGGPILLDQLRAWTS